MQVEDVDFIPQILNDPRFAGKDDPELTRLKQYKLLETRKNDEEAATGGNEEFLRGCDVRVYIEYDVNAHLDRAIELINRTNQLNYTKRRLPEDIVEARKALLAELEPFNRQVGLVRVLDKYGDYGFVGFFETELGRKTMVPGTGDSKLRHYCFSCRTLGMLIEKWLYDHLLRPELEVVGEVLTDLWSPKVVDWVTLVPSLDDSKPQRTIVASEIVLGGGCESTSLAFYLNAYTERLNVYGNHVASGLFTHFHSAVIVESMCDRTSEEFRDEAELLGLSTHLMAGDIISECGAASVLIFNFSRDCFPQKCFRHKTHGWKFWIEPAVFGGFNFVDSSEEELAQRVAGRGEAEHLIKIARHMRENYTYSVLTEAETVQSTLNLIGRVPLGSKFIIIMNHNEVRDIQGALAPHPFLTRYTQIIRDVARDYPYVEVVSFSEAIRSSDEILPGGANHYSRAVFLRFAERLAEVMVRLPSKQEPALLVPREGFNNRLPVHA